MTNKRYNRRAKELIVAVVAAISGITLSIMLCGCSNYKKIAIEAANISQVEMDSFTSGRIAADVTLSNPTSAALKAEEAEAQLLLDGEAFAELKQIGSVTFPPKGSSRQRVLLAVEIKDGSALLKAGLKPERWSRLGITANYAITLSNGMASRRLKGERVPVRELLQQLTPAQSNSTAQHGRTLQSGGSTAQH